MKSTQAFAAVLAVFSSLSAAYGDTNLNCDVYATTAVLQNEVNVNIGCGFSGGRWSDNYEGHKAWCLSQGVQMQHLTTEDRARSGALGECQAMQQNTCRDYADDAINRAKLNVSYGCGFQGGAYADDYDGHYKWCLSVNMNVAANEKFNRNAEIGQCFAQKQGGLCGIYATAMAPLYQRQNEACVGRSDFQLVVSNPEFDRNDCMQNAGLDADWVNDRVTAMNARIAICEQNVATYSPTNFRGVPLDGCTDETGRACGKPTADLFCQLRGHAASQSHATGGTNFSVYQWCLDRDAAETQKWIDQGGTCFCSDSSNGCGYFTEITCTGRK